MAFILTSLFAVLPALGITSSPSENDKPERTEARSRSPGLVVYPFGDVAPSGSSGRTTYIKRESLSPAALTRSARPLSTTGPVPKRPTTTPPSRLTTTTAGVPSPSPRPKKRPDAPRALRPPTPDTPPSSPAPRSASGPRASSSGSRKRPESPTTPKTPAPRPRSSKSPAVQAFTPEESPSPPSRIKANAGPLTGDDLLEAVNSKLPVGWDRYCKLLDHQVEGRVWMAKQELGKYKGGILNDMGLGKTPTVLTRIVDSVTLQQEGGRTLVVGPANICTQWEREIKKFCPNLRAYLHHGGQRTKNAAHLERFDIIITSYGTLLSEHNNKLAAEKAEADGKPVNGEQFTALLDAEFLRVVLDEAHMIRNPEAKRSLACYALVATYRWYVTGTVIHNGGHDLYSPIKFLRAGPFDDKDYFEAHKHSSVHVRFVRKFTLCRKKTDIANGKPLLELPSRTVHLQACEFEPQQQAFYSSIQEQMRHQLGNDYLQFREQKDVSLMVILVMLLRLRQACLHPDLCLKDEELSPEERKAVKNRCGLCQKELKRNATLRYCDTCRKEIIPKVRNMPSSAKIKTALEIILDIVAKSGGKDKIVIFSQWTSFFDILQPFLADAGINFVRYDGKMTSKARDDAVVKLNKDPSVTVALVSFMAGSVGLNLNAANHVIMMDLWWNPALEEQAFDRVHRIGQTKPVHIYKLYIKDTIEDRILDIQERKRNEAEAFETGVKMTDEEAGWEAMRLQAIFDLITGGR